MPNIDPEPPDPSCSRLLPRGGITENQLLGPDPFSSRTRDARGRFAKGSSGNPRGRPRGIGKPKRRVPDLVARPLSAGVGSARPQAPSAAAARRAIVTALQEL